MYDGNFTVEDCLQRIKFSRATPDDVYTDEFYYRDESYLSQ